MSQKAILRKKQYGKGIYQPYPRGTFEHDLFRMINSQGMPDTILGTMCGIGDSTINKWRCKRRPPTSIPTIQKLAQRCGYRLTLVRVVDGGEE